MLMLSGRVLARVCVVAGAAAPYAVYREWHGIDRYGGDTATDATQTQIIVLAALKTMPALLSAGMSSLTSWLGVGFFFCALGDALLQMDDRSGFPQLFVPGLAAFLIGHLAFLSSFVLRGGNRLEGDATAASALIAFVIVSYLWESIGDDETVLRVALPAYAMTIGTMCNRAIGMYRSVKLRDHSCEESLAGMCAVIGAVIFMISDTLIAVDRFKQPLGAWRNFYIETTYFSALALISLGDLVQVHQGRTKRGVTKLHES